jgi:hypothetical protein
LVNIIRFSKPAAHTQVILHTLAFNNNGVVQEIGISAKQTHGVIIAVPLPVGLIAKNLPKEQQLQIRPHAVLA